MESHISIVVSMKATLTRPEEENLKENLSWSVRIRKFHDLGLNMLILPYSLGKHFQNLGHHTS